MIKSVLLIYLLCFQAQAFTVLIDPGHGGHDHGAETKLYSNKKWKRIKEKDIALSIAKKIHYYLKKYKVDSYLTRSFDRDLTLEQRAEQAERIKCDFFISVHINASKKNKANGFETYYLDNHKDEAVRKVEAIENKNLKGEERVINKILTDLVIERTAPLSKSLAENIHGEIKKRVGKKYKMKDRGIKPGIFYVLALTKRPGVLLEAGFISNAKELKIMLDEKFQRRYAKAVAKGMVKYIRTHKKQTPSLF